MKPISLHLHLSVITALLALAGSGVQAQPGPGPGAGPGPAASAPGPGMGMGPGKGSGMGPGQMGGGGAGARMHGRSGSRYTPGWSLMTPAERTEHQQRMGQATSYEECTALRDQHREQMAARAKEKGLSQPLATPRRDACAALKPKAP